MYAHFHTYLPTYLPTYLQARSFLDTLEPYLLADRLRQMTPQAMTALLEHCLDRKYVGR